MLVDKCLSRDKPGIKPIFHIPLHSSSSCMWQRISDKCNRLINPLKEKLHDRKVTKCLLKFLQHKYAKMRTRQF